MDYEFQFLIILYILGLIFYTGNVLLRSKCARKEHFWYAFPVITYLIHGFVYSFFMLLFISQGQAYVYIKYLSWSIYLQCHLVIALIAKEITSFLRRRVDSLYWQSAVDNNKPEIFDEGKI